MPGAYQRLPAGRHGLSRSFVVENQRARLLAAVVEAVATAGYAEMTVESVIAVAGVSRRTFYEHFRNKEDAFLAAYDDAVDRLERRTRESIRAHQRIADRFRAGVTTFMEFFAAEPLTARACVVEVLAAGPRARARREEALRRFEALIESDLRDRSPRHQTPALTAEMTAGGLYEVVYARVVRDAAGELPALVPDVMRALFGRP